jgi:hypothetical protein
MRGKQSKQVYTRAKLQHLVFYPPSPLTKKYFSSYSSSLSDPLVFQMTDSYASSRTGDLSATPNGYANGSAPSLGTNAGISSVIRKKLMGYVGFANLPNQVHRKSVRKGFQFTTMVVGAWLIQPYNFVFP